jgi:hypothetical protein
MARAESPRGCRTRGLGFIRLCAAMTAVATLGGCALNADFDRARPSLVTDDMHAWIGRDAARNIGLPSSDNRLTDDERALRDLAYPLIAPPYDRNRWYSVVNEYGLGQLPREPAQVDTAAYWKRLNERYRRSEASGYAQLITDARNDVVRIEPFFAVAGRVLDMDHKRAKSLAHVAELSAAEEGNALNRNNENSAIVDWVCRSLFERTASYGYALERMVIMAPSPAAIEAERSLTLLQTRAGQSCSRGQSSRIVAKD